jgi:CheY-like chemotaxis protein
MKGQNCTVLVVEEDENDRFFIQRSFEKLSHPYQLRSLTSANQAIAYISGEGNYGDRQKFPFPSYIITDLKMSDGDGFKLLDFIKQNPALSIIPVVMLSTSNDPDDIRQAYLLGASSYFVKRSAVEIGSIIRTIHDYWAKCEVPAIDSEGYAIMTNSVGRLGARFPRTRRSPGALNPPSAEDIGDDWKKT